MFYKVILFRYFYKKKKEKMIKIVICNYNIIILVNYFINNRTSY